MLLSKHLLLLHDSHLLLLRHLLHGSWVHGLAMRLYVIALAVTLSHVVTWTSTTVEGFATLATTLATLVTAISLVLAILTVHLTIVLHTAAELTLATSHVV